VENYIIDYLIQQYDSVILLFSTPSFYHFPRRNFAKTYRENGYWHRWLFQLFWMLQRELLQLFWMLQRELLQLFRMFQRELLQLFRMFQRELLQLFRMFQRELLQILEQSVLFGTALGTPFGRRLACDSLETGGEMLR